MMQRSKCVSRRFDEEPRKMHQHVNKSSDNCFMIINCKGCGENRQLHCNTKARKFKCLKCRATLCELSCGTPVNYIKNRDDYERQNDEITALRSIYSDDEFQLLNDAANNNAAAGPYTGCLKIPVNLPKERFTINFHIFTNGNNDAYGRDVAVNDDYRTESCVVKYLPPLELFFWLPSDYPSCSRPLFVLRCPWLSDRLLVRVCSKLTNLWFRNEKTEILYTWTSFIQQDLMQFLKLDDEITIPIFETSSDYVSSRASSNNKDDERGGQRKKKEEDANDDINSDKVILFESNPVTYTKYCKDGGGCSSSSSVLKIDTSRIGKPSCSSTVGVDKSRKNNTNNNVKTVNYVRLNGNIKFLCKDKGKYKYETEKEAKKRLENELLYVEADAKQYAVTSGSIRGLQESHPSSSFVEKSTGKNVDGAAGKITADNEGDDNEYLSENDRLIYGWLKLRSRVRMIAGRDYTRNRFVASEDFKSAVKVRLIKRWNRTQFERRQHSCEICYSGKMGSACTVILPCCHVFCNECIRQYVCTAVSECTVRNGLVCLTADCECRIRDYQLKQLLSLSSDDRSHPRDDGNDDENLFRAYCDQKLKYAVEMDENLLYCPREACRNIAYILNNDAEETADNVDTGDIIGHCPRCLFYFCVYCKKAYHGKQYCLMKTDERKRILEQYANGTAHERAGLEKRFSKKQLEKWSDDQKTEDWIRDKGKRCPKCKAIIEKYSGCNKMVCVRCKTPFCWTCNEILNLPDPYMHFRDPQSPCYDKLFLGVEEQDNDLDFLLDDEDYILIEEEEEEQEERDFYRRFLYRFIVDYFPQVHAGEEDTDTDDSDISEHY